jgi:hypothetical protein
MKNDPKEPHVMVSKYRIDRLESINADLLDALKRIVFVYGNIVPQEVNTIARAAIERATK